MTIPMINQLVLFLAKYLHKIDWLCMFITF